MDALPVDALDRVNAGAHVRPARDEAQYLCRLEADVGVDEQEMRRFRVVEKLRDEARASARDERVRILEQDFELDVRRSAQHFLQLEHGGGIDDGKLTAETRCRDNQLDL